MKALDMIPTDEQKALLAATFDSFGMFSQQSIQPMPPHNYMDRVETAFQAFYHGVACGLAMVGCTDLAKFLADTGVKVEDKGDRLVFHAFDAKEAANVQ